jgi:glycosyltransferase involved in cell wall biosynthesis
MGKVDWHFEKIMVIISNGFSKFFLAVAAAEAERRQLLSYFLTGAYPKPLARKILALPYLRTNAKAQRLSARREQISDELVHALFAAEALYALGLLRRNDATVVKSFRLYGWLATHHVERAAAKGARIYHYRAGFGGKSLEVARKLGMLLLCDHSIAHPAVVDALIENLGKMPPEKEAMTISPFWRYILHDIEQADAVLVNSCFVKDTFRHAGHGHSPIHVIYLGVDDSFMAQIPQRKNVSAEFRMLFAGSFDKRKGAETLMDALGRLENLPWQLEIAGPLDTNVMHRHRDFFSNPRVKCIGRLSRGELAQAMSRADVFVFPSLAEGSARVIFEALACGCYVITTPNSGSIVESGVHGSVVPPGDSRSLADAIQYAYHRRDTIAEIGRNNAQVVRDEFTQRDYGSQLSALYKELLGES